jgi:hypothetical protein
MQHGEMADGTILADIHREARVDVQDGVFLDAGAPPDPDRLVVSPDRGTEP